MNVPGLKNSVNESNLINNKNQNSKHGLKEQEQAKKIFKESINNDKIRRNFIKTGYIKISRKQFPELKSSLLIEKTGKNISDIKIYSYIHGSKGILGKGGSKTAKYVEEMNGNEKLVVSKFHFATVDYIKKTFPEMLESLKELKDTTHVSGGTFAALNSFTCNIDYPVIINKFGEMDLHKEIKKKELTKEVKNKYAKELLQGLVEMHEKGIVHLDIKPENVFIIKGIAHLSDLDFARYTWKKEEDKIAGTSTHIAPEFAKRKVKNIEGLKAADVYSTGITLYELFEEKHPWFVPKGNITAKEYLQNELMKMSKFKFKKTFPEPEKRTIEHLVWEMKHLDPKKRPTAQEALDRLLNAL